MDRIFEFAVASRKPWLLLMPQYVARKSFFLEWMNNRRAASGLPRPTFLGPAKQPYVFAAPAVRPDVRNMRQQQQQPEGRGEGLDEACRVDSEQHATTPTEVVSACLDDAGSCSGAQGGSPSDAFAVAAGSFQVTCMRPVA